MNDYNKNTFLSYTDKNTEEKKYYMRLGKEVVEVPEDVYRVCYNSYKKQLRDNYKDLQFGLLSYDQELKDGTTLLDKISISDKEDDGLELILDIINSLDTEDKVLIKELLIEERKEKEVAAFYHLTQQGINKRKRRILSKIKKQMNKKSK